MEELLKLQKKIIPELIETLEKRYNILRNIYYNQPIGRRTLALKMNFGERIIRTEVEVLKKQDLLEIQSFGMYVTHEGEIIIDKLKDYVHSLKDLKSLEKKLEEILSIKKVIIVPGHYDNDNLIIRDIGKTSSECIKSILKDNNIIGITGGLTMAQVAQEMPYDNTRNNILVLPARGGLGKNVESQANNVAAKLAKKLNGSYKLFHVPDSLEKKALDAVLQIPEIKEFKSLIKKIDILVFGLGRADEMAERRKLPEDAVKRIMNRGAVAEAFGYYFNRKGEKVWESSTVGLSLVDLNNVKNVIGIACGEKKAEAIMAIASLKRDMILIIDEGVSRKILETTSE